MATYSLAERRYVTVAAPQGAARPQFLADGHHLIAMCPGRLVLLDTAGGPANDLAAAPPGHRYAYLALSANRRWIATFDSADESDIWLATIEAGASGPR
jgi:hypothetical protein